MIAVAALGGAAIRIVSPAVPRGLERLLAAAPVAAAAAVCEALALGLADLGTDPAALTVAALLTWGAARPLAAPELGVWRELVGWWAEAGSGARAVTGAVFGAAIAWIAWNLWRPTMGVDSVYYHLPEIVAWVHGGSPGSDELISPWLHVGSYPLANEVLVAWAVGISGGLAVLGIANVALLGLIVAGGVVGLRELAVEARLRGLAIAAVLSVPMLISQVDGPANDVPAAAWLVCAGALAAGSRRRPLLIAPMLLAAGLAIGSKTTALPLAAVLVGFSLIRSRAALRARWRPLTLAALVALAVGGFWYLRTLVEHGSPFWPFAATPWGDPVPPLLDTYRSLFSEPTATLGGRLDDYATVLAGGWVMIFAALLSPLWARRREVTVCAGLVGASVLLWSLAPTTGVSDYPVIEASVSQTRYLFPALVLSVLTLTLSARGGGRPRAVAATALGFAVAWNLVQLVSGDFPAAFSTPWILLGALAGAAAWLGFSGAARRPSAGGAASGAVLAATAAIATAAAITLAADGYALRHADRNRTFDAEIVRWFESAPRAGDERPIYMAPELAGALTGDRLERRLELIELDATCAEVEALRERGWVLLHPNDIFESVFGYRAGRCRPDGRFERVGFYRVYPPL